MARGQKTDNCMEYLRAPVKDCVALLFIVVAELDLRDGSFLGLIDLITHPNQVRLCQLLRHQSALVECKAYIVFAD